MNERRLGRRTKILMAAGAGTIGLAAVVNGCDWVSVGGDGASHTTNDGTAKVTIRGVGEIKPLTIKMTRVDYYHPERETITLDKNAYEQQGGTFREIIRDLEAKRDRTAIDVEGVYQIHKEAHRGVEYLNGGEVFGPRNGEKFRIDDPPSSEPGIALRNERNDLAKFFNHNGYIYDGTIVRIISDPIEETDSFGKKRVWLRVRVVEKSAGFKNPANAEVGDEGFIDRKWLDEKLEETAAQGN